MRKRLKQSFLKNKNKRLLSVPGTILLLLLIVLAACSPKTETITVEVTRVVTETVIEEGESVEVTRVVTETIVESIEIEPEEESDTEPPSATGSEGDAGPLPPIPTEGPKVPARRGSSAVASLAIETAVTLRAAQTNNEFIQQTAVVAPTIISPSEWQQACDQVKILYKKRCD